MAGLALLTTGVTPAVSAVAGPLPSEVYTPSVPQYHPFASVADTADAPALVLSPATRRHHRGQRVAWACTVLGAGEVTRVVRIGSPGASRLAIPAAADYCIVTITAERSSRHPQAGGGVLRITRHHHLRQSVPVTAAGRVYVARLRGTVRVLNGLQVADLQYIARRAYPPGPELVGGTEMVALAGPTSLAPVGRVGAWTDGAQHIRVSRGLASGGQLFFDRNRSTLIVDSNVNTEIQRLDRTPVIDTLTVTDRLI